MPAHGYLLVRKSPVINGSVELVGAKNAVLVIIASLILTRGKSIISNVPSSVDVQYMIMLLRDLGAHIEFDAKAKILIADTSSINSFEVKPEIMNKMRASILVMGPLLARFGKAKVALPGGCLIGARPIDYHLKGFRQMGVKTEDNIPFLDAEIAGTGLNLSRRIVLEYPSVGATENIMMFATLQPGLTVIVNAALEPEVLDLIDLLRKMGAKIVYEGSIITIQGVDVLSGVEHSVIPDRLEAGAVLLSAAMTGGTIDLPTARADHMDTFLEKLKEMGHLITCGTNATQELPLQGIRLQATREPRAISVKTGPYPCFPTDLQAPLMAALCLANGTSTVEETVFENRLIHVQELQKMGAQITLKGSKAVIRGVDHLYGCEVIATDIRASCALVLAGFVAEGETKIIGDHHWRRGYDNLEEKLHVLGAHITLFSSKSE
ncbi:MAG: UDP-N-acetylglucosamine 1-carboxyvinyltransferase [bacterium]